MRIEVAIPRGVVLCAPFAVQFSSLKQYFGINAITAMVHSAKCFFSLGVRGNIVKTKLYFKN